MLKVWGEVIPMRMNGIEAAGRFGAAQVRSGVGVRGQRKGRRMVPACGAPDRNPVWHRRRYIRAEFVRHRGLSRAQP